jgi:hypothetical protein
MAGWFVEIKENKGRKLLSPGWMSGNVLGEVMPEGDFPDASGGILVSDEIMWAIF